MKSRQEHKRAYQERPKSAGVFQIRNTRTAKVLLGSSLNLDGVWNRHHFMLTIGSHPNPILQADWRTYGAEAFAFEILELVKDDDLSDRQRNDELRLLEAIWLEQIPPLSGHSYHQTNNIRQV